MNPKFILCLALVLGAALLGCSSANQRSSVSSQRPDSSFTEPNLMAAGDWSETMHGLRGRLLFAQGEKFNGTLLGVVYLELQNVSGVLGAMEIGPNRSLDCTLIDGTGKPVAQSLMPVDMLCPLPYWIALPCNSTLRYEVSVNGYGVPKDSGLLIGLMSGGWIIPPASHNDYYLSASFNVSPATISAIAAGEAWQGVLKLPKVKIP